MQTIDDQTSTPPAADKTAAPPFGVNEMRLSLREWIVTLVIVTLVCLLAPRIWKQHEAFSTGPDYRIPYPLSNDYWLFARRLEQTGRPERIAVLGDSVVWGEYVAPDGTLSHFLNEQAGEKDRFINAGVNGMFPLALEGLVKDYGGALNRQKVIVVFNLLWMTSAEADLSDTKKHSFNHSRLVPQFFPALPSYGGDAQDRLSAEITRHNEFLSWVDHIQVAYFGQKSLPQWTLLEDRASSSLTYANAWRSPLAGFAAGIPSEPVNDPQRGLKSARHHAWNRDGAETIEYDWVAVDQSLQLAACQRVVQLLGDRGNDVLVILAPFNKHMLSVLASAVYAKRRAEIAQKLEGHCTVILAETLPSDLYADASHPLTDGYALMARNLWNTAKFRDWVAK